MMCSEICENLDIFFSCLGFLAEIFKLSSVGNFYFLAKLWCTRKILKNHRNNQKITSSILMCSTRKIRERIFETTRKLLAVFWCVLQERFEKKPLKEPQIPPESWSSNSFSLLASYLFLATWQLQNRDNFVKRTSVGRF